VIVKRITIRFTLV